MIARQVGVTAIMVWQMQEIYSMVIQCSPKQSTQIGLASLVSCEVIIFKLACSYCNTGANLLTYSAIFTTTVLYFLITVILRTTFKIKFSPSVLIHFLRVNYWIWQQKRHWRKRRNLGIIYKFTFFLVRVNMLSTVLIAIWSLKCYKLCTSLFEHFSVTPWTFPHIIKYLYIYIHIVKSNQVYKEKKLVFHAEDYISKCYWIVLLVLLLFFYRCAGGKIYLGNNMFFIPQISKWHVALFI